MMQPLLTFNQVAAFVAILIANPQNRLTYQRNVHFWRIEPGNINEQNKAHFTEAAADANYKIKLMQDGSSIMYEAADHQTISTMLRTEYEGICHVNNMLEFAHH